MRDTAALRLRPAWVKNGAATQLLPQGTQLRLQDAATSPRLRFSVGSHKVSYAKCPNLLETGPLAICHRDLPVGSVQADSNREGMTQIEPETTKTEKPRNI
jgi:hypothetical protein